MGLQDTVHHAIHGAIDKVRRSAIAYGICAVCGLAALALGTAAGITAMIPLVGIVYALLIAACLYLLIVAGVLLWLHQPATVRPATAQPFGAQPFSTTADAGTAQRQAQFAQIAMLVEAVMLGFSLSRRR